MQVEQQVDSMSDESDFPRSLNYKTRLIVRVYALSLCIRVPPPLLEFMMNLLALILALILDLVLALGPVQCPFSYRYSFRLSLSFLIGIALAPVSSPRFLTAHVLVLVLLSTSCLMIK